MRKYGMSLVLLFATLCLSSQNGNMDFADPNENFYDTQKRLNKHFKKYERELARERRERANGRSEEENEEEREVAGYEVYKRWEHYMAPRVYPSGDKTLPSRAFEEYQNNLAQNAQQRQNNSVQSNTWQALGPFGDPAGGNAGRVSTVRFDPSNANGLWVCTPDGGLWSSTDNGTNWTTNTNQLSVIGNTDVAFDPTNSQIMYMATGEGDHSDTYSTGVLKSTDGGATWNATGLAWTVSQGRVIHKLLINPLNKNVLFAAASSGLYRSTNAGTTWAVVQAGNFKDIEYRPSDTSTVYAVTSGTFYKSTNGGSTFATVTSGLPVAGACNRLAIAVTAANSSYVYVVGSDAASSGFYGFYQSTNSGTSFTSKATSPNLLGWASAGNDAGGQGWYTLAIAANPTNASEVIVGGVNTWKTTNGGSTWTLYTHWTGSGAPFAHADCHDVEYKNASTIYLGTDGGIFYTSNGGGAFSSINGNMNIAQIYKIGLSKNTYSLAITGHQDNGSNLYTAAGWSNTRGGDGMDCFIDWNNDQVMYASYVNGVLYRTTNGGTNWSTITPGASGSGAWETPWHQDPTTATTIYAGYQQMWKSTNQGTTWGQMGTLPGSSQVAEFAVAPSNNQVIYVIQGNTLIKTTNGGTSWSNVTGTLPTGSAQLTWVSVEDDDPNSVWVTFSGYSNGNKVYNSTNGGTSWTNYSTGLPNLPTNCITYSNGTKDGLYVGCDVGVYYRDSTMSSWTSYNTGLPNVSVHDLEIFYPTGKVRAATFGRGVWEADLYSKVPNAVFSSSASKCTGQNITFTDQSTNSPTSWSWTFSGGTPASSTLQNPTVSFATAGTHTVTLTATNANGSSTPTTQTITIVATPTITITGGSTICAGASVVLTGGTASTYTWSANAGSATTNTVSVSPTTTSVYTLTGANGSCTNTATSTVTVNPSPTVTVNSPTVCAGSSAVLTASGATSYSWSTSATTNTISVTPSSTTVYTVTGSSSGCSSSKTSTVTVTPNPTITVNSPTLCPGSSAILTASGATTYSWSTSATTNTISVTPSSTTVYSVTGTSSGCTSSKTSTVTVTPNPTITVNSPTVCAGSSAILTASGATTYSWSTSATTNTISVTPSSTTVYSVTGTSSGCTSSKTSTVTVTPNPTITVNSPTVCAGSSVVLSAGGATSYIWSTSETTNTISVSPSTTTVYTVTGNSNGCSSANTSTVTIIPNPTITVNSATVCAGSSAVLSASGAASYTWSTSETTNTISVSPSSTTVYTVTGASAGCSSASTSTVSVTPNPAVTVNSATVCAGSPATLTASGATTYSWSTSAITNTISVSPTATEVYTVTGTTSGCSATNTSTVVVTPNPTVTVNNATICSGENAILTANGASTYTWNTGNSGASYTTSPGSTTVYTVTGTTSGCDGNASATVTVNSLPNVSVNSDSICVGGSTTLNASGASTYSWSPATGLSPTSGATVTASPTVTTTYSVTGTDINTCSETATATVVVDGCLGITRINGWNFSVYPNPANDKLYIETSVSITIKLFDAIGQCALEQSIAVGKNEINIGNLATGIYFVKMISGQAQRTTKLIKE